MIEREMDDRGSKSKLSLNRLISQNLNFVKEQRVDGSLCLIKKHIRCILMDFERNYQIKILSNQIRTFSYFCKTKNNSFESNISLKQIRKAINLPSSPTTPRGLATGGGGRDLDTPCGLDQWSKPHGEVRNILNK